MENHYFDAAGVYTGSAPAHADSLPPADAVRDAPPSRPGFWPVRDADGGGWVLVEDHRGRRGRIGGEPAVVAVLGPLPEGWSDDSPRVYLTAAGTYHRDGCRYTGSAGGWTDLDAARARNPRPKPCGRCHPPAL